MPTLTETEASSLATMLEMASIPFQQNIDLSSFSYLGTGGIAGIVIFPQNADQLIKSARILHEKSLRYKVIGNTSNIMFLDQVNYSVLVSTSHMNAITYDARTASIVAECGVMMPALARKALLESVKGFEGLEGIPGTVGGGIVMNAGAYDCELKDNLTAADLIFPDGSLKTVTVEALGLGYRTSILKHDASGAIASKLYFNAPKGDAAQIYRKMELFHAKRHKYQEFMYRNLGSIFSGSPYRALGEADMVFRFISAAYYFFCYKVKLFRREAPINRKWLNDIAVKRFRLHYKFQPFSDKTLNCLVNRGQGTAEMVRYITDLKRLMKDQIPIENEIIEEF